MAAELQDNQRHLWNQVLEAVSRKIGRHSFDTWFAPVVFLGCDETSCQLTVPNESFRAALLENYSDVLGTVVEEVFESPRQLVVSTQAVESSCRTALQTTLPVVQACHLKAANPEDQWLIENLWLAESVGIIGGPPRAYKSWVALDMAVSVASGSPCLGAFTVHTPGPVLLFAAEDSDSSVRFRLESIVRSRQIDFDRLDVRVITVDRLRLDHADDQERFEATVVVHRPKLVILDPLVRIHGADENASSAVAALLGYFRSLQRKTGAAIALVHHARKDLSTRAGYGLRGSSDFYAWTDCLLYMERRHEQRRLLVEHRSASGSGPFTVELAASSTSHEGPYPILRQNETTDALPDNIAMDERILTLLSKSAEPLPAETIRTTFRVRKQRLLEVLRNLSETGKIVKLPQGYTIKSIVS